MKTKVLALLAVGVLGTSVNANAIPLRLDATSLDAEHSDFFVIFDDTGDGLLQNDEVTDFSGVFLFPEGTLYNLLVGVPTIADISSVSGFCPLADRWCFVSPDIGLLVAVSTDVFAYAITPAPVAESGTLALFGLGLLGVGLTRRRRANSGRFTPGCRSSPATRRA
jgi:PEP-CTERM motif